MNSSATTDASTGGANRPDTENAFRAAWFDRVSGVEHSRAVTRPFHRLAALALTFGLIAGNAAICAGWMPGPEARMACCADGADCPMHKGGSHHSGSSRVPTQDQADSCCALSEGPHSSPPTATLGTIITVTGLGAGTVLPATVPPLVLTDGWRSGVPRPVAPVPRHLLLSVFLV